MNVSAWSIRNPIAAVLFFFFLTVVGIGAFRAMKIQTFPDIDLPTILVSTGLPGAAPAQLETEVARRLENNRATLDNLKQLKTTIQDGVVVIAAEFRLEKSSQEALDEVRDAVARARSELPPGTRDPVVTRLNMGAMPILAYSISSDRLDEEGLSWFVDNTVARRLLRLRGVGSVQRVGGVDREILVELDPARMLALNVSALDISRQLGQVQQDASGGRASLGGAEQSIRTVASVQTVDELAAMELSLSDGRRLRLDQVASVRDTVAERRSTALLNGEAVVGFEIARAPKAGEVEVAELVRAELQALREDFPDITLTEAFNRVDPVEENYRGSMWLLYEGALLAVLVVFGFLRNWRATLIAATALPLSIIPAFAVMHHGLGLTLNLVTLLSLSLVVGILVDDAIVEIENIMRHLQMGKTPYQAAMEAADEIGLAVIATTVTLVAVFLPTAFLAGVPGRFFVHFGWTAAIAVVFSTVVARMLTPMMAAYLLKPSTKSAHDASWLKPYGRLAAWVLRHRVWTLLLTLVFFVGSFFLLPWIGKGFIPADDTSQTQVRLTLQPGSTYAQTLAAAEHARVLVSEHPAVQRVYTAVGGGSTGVDPITGTLGAEVRTATLTINLTPRSERKGLSKQAVEGDLRRALLALPHARVQVGFGGSSETFTLLVSGEEGGLLEQHARQIERDLRALPGVGNVISSASLIRQELVVRPDAARAAELGVTTAAIAQSIRVATAGDFEQSLAKLNVSERQLPVVVRLPVQARTDLDLLARLPVPGSRGMVPLSSVATLAVESGPSQIDRQDRRRTITLDVELNQRSLGELQREIFQMPSVQNPPAGIEARGIGDAESMKELFDSFGVALATGLLCIYIVLVLLFKDFMQPITILGALVLSVPGALLALFVTQTDLAMPSLIGLIMLMGIATKNAILIVDYAIMARRQHGMPRIEAVLDACHKRARPIVMTTIAMAAGMTPIALGIGVDPSFRAPMGIVVIGGLITSTVLSLFVIPVLFTVLDDWAQAALRVWRRFNRVSEAPAVRPGA